MNTLSLPGRIAGTPLVLVALVAGAGVFVLVSNGTIGEQSGRNFFAVFAILFGAGFIRDAFRGEGGPQGIRSITLKFTSLAFTLGLITGGWTENWLLLTTGGVAAGVVFSVVERAMSGSDGPHRGLRLAVWIPVGLAAMGEGAYIIAPL